MRRGRILIFLVLIVVIGLALLYFAYTQFGGGITAQPTQAALTEVYFAAQNIPQGTTITQEMLSFIKSSKVICALIESLAVHKLFRSRIGRSYRRECQIRQEDRGK
jgi:hypothetical protein